jgi:hypothetical protein
MMQARSVYPLGFWTWYRAAPVAAAWAPGVPIASPSRSVARRSCGAAPGDRD